MDLNEIHNQYPWFFPSLAIVLYLIVRGFLKNKIRSVVGFNNSNPAKAKKVIEEILNQTVPFFRNLTAESKKKFILRVAAFISAKRFLGMEGLQVTFEMKVRIAATAVKLTFGLAKTGLRHYKVIKIFPESFYSRMHDRYLKGGASTGGTLLFSWKDFEEGYQDPSDRYNLGLHEMAHALRIELKYGSDFDNRFADYTDQWEKLALPEFEKMNQGKTSFLRDYGGTNMEEFFAVCVEHFFEVPDDFRKQLPDIYNHLCFLLNLDPLRKESDYALEPDFVRKVNSNTALLPLPVKVKKAYQYYDWHWSYTGVLSGLFGGVFVILFLYGKVLYTSTHVLAVLLLTVLTVFAFRKWFYNHGILGINHLVFFSLAGAFPLFTAVLLLMNYHISDSVEVKVFRVVDYSVILEDRQGIRSKHLLLQLENNALTGYRNIRSFPLTDFEGADTMEEIRVVYTFSSGLLGVKNLENRQIIVPGQGSDPFF
jgi:Mlc titration factor MtfA (ptsG expression regulator)